MNYNDEVENFNNLQNCLFYGFYMNLEKVIKYSGVGFLNLHIILIIVCTPSYLN